MATVVVSGATGFIGSAVTSHLAQAGYTVVPVSRKVLPHVRQVADYAESPAADILFHFAEEAHRERVNALGEDYLQHTASVARALCDGRYRRIIYGSSAAVYADGASAPFDVDSPTAARDTYTRSKLRNEQIILDAGGLVVRFSNIFGQGMAANTVIPDILRQLCEVGPLRVRDGSPVRDFLSVSDAARALTRAAESVYQGVLNVGSGRGTSISALAELIVQLAGQRREVVSGPPSKPLSNNVLDIGCTTRVLGWSPSVSLQDDLRVLVNGALRANNAQA
jgi:UDP-glucose 4-epimerase